MQENVIRERERGTDGEERDREGKRKGQQAMVKSLSFSLFPSLYDKYEKGRDELIQNEEEQRRRDVNYLSKKRHRKWGL